MRLPRIRFAKQRDELSEELRAHLRMAMADRMECGESEEEARRNAVRELGNIPLIEDVTREMWGGVWLERVLQDVRYALRQLRRAPGFAVTMVVTLALGLGAAVAMYTVVDRVLLRPLPYRDAGSLVQISEIGKDGTQGWGNMFLDIAEWQSRSHRLQSIAFWNGNGAPGGLSYLEGKDGSIEVAETTASANLFSTLGVHAEMGRTFLEGESGSARPEDAHTILLSDAIWRNAFGADPQILGRTVKVSGEAYTVIGVMPRGFAFPFGQAHSMVWVPIVPSREDRVRADHGTPVYEVIARLAPGASLTAAGDELQEIQRDVAAQYTDLTYREHIRFIHVARYEDTLVDDSVRKALLALGGAAALLWLIACVNVTSLLLARATARQREIAVRGALGASRGRIVQQLLIEGLMLSGAAALVGIALAIVTLRGFEHGLETQFGIYTMLSPNLHVLGVLLLLTVISALTSSAWPALTAARAPIEPSLRQGTAQSGMGRKQHRLRAALVVAEIAMSLTPLVACGLLLRTIYTLRHVPLGFRTDHIVVASMTIPNFRYAGRDLYKDLYAPLLERVQHLPGVESAALMTDVPMGKNFRLGLSFNGDGKTAADIRHSKIQAQARAVTPEMQQVFQFRMVRGRFFNKADTAASLPVVVVNREFVRQYKGEDSDPGKFLGTPLIGFKDKRQAVVVGVLDDERQDGVAEPSGPEIELCMPQITPGSTFYGVTSIGMSLAVRTRRNPAAVIPELRDVMRQASPKLANSTFTTMEQVVEDSYGSQQLTARLLEIFGGTALVLCIAGIYGLLAYLVTQRTRELGIRIALGAQRTRLMAMVLRQAGGMLMAGLAAGLLLAYATSRLVSTLLYGVKPHDPWTMTAVALILLMGGLAAACIPARRAAGVDPMVALRSE
jgi:predicted permease